MSVMHAREIVLALLKRERQARIMHRNVAADLEVHTEIGATGLDGLGGVCRLTAVLHHFEKGTRKKDEWKTKGMLLQSLLVLQYARRFVVTVRRGRDKNGSPQRDGGWTRCDVMIDCMCSVCDVWAEELYVCVVRLCPGLFRCIPFVPFVVSACRFRIHFGLDN